MKFTISILAHNRIELTKKCVFSVLANSQDFELILTDNGSTDGTLQYFNHVAAMVRDVSVIRHETNQGFINPNKHALSIARGDRFVMLNNDTVVHGDWLTKLDEPFRRFSTAALCCPEGGCSELLPSFHGRPGKFEYCEGAMLMCRTDLVRKHGLFSPELVGAYGEDSDLSLRMREQGYTIHRVPVHYEHMRGATSKTVPEAQKWQEINHEVNRKRWSHYLKARRFDYPTLIKRPAAFGDVLLTTPIIRELKKMRPCSPIWMETACGDILKNHPQIERMERRFQSHPMDALVIDLHMAYENMLSIHICDAYAKAAGISGYEKVTEMFLSKDDEAYGERVVQGPMIAIHMGPTSWESKNWLSPKWTELIARLPYKVAVVGHHRHPVEGVAVNLCGLATYHQAAAVIKRCKLFIGVDSLPIHIAQAVKTPVVGLFGVTLPEYILTDGSPWKAVVAEGPTKGERHRVTGKNRIEDPHHIMHTITVDQVLAKCEEALK